AEANGALAVPCLGHCDLAPVRLDGEEVVGGVTHRANGFLVEPDELRVLPELAPERVLELLKESGLVGMGGAGFPTWRKWEAVRAGSYVCGEETAMLESMEGRRGMPRLRPPFPAQRGHLARPTLINNVETLAHLARIVRGEWTPGRLWSVSGAVRKPGCYEAP